MKTVILNDTSNQRHHGCKTVIRVLKNLCRAHNTKILSSGFVHTDWKKNRLLLDNISEADVILINGEGTIHHGAFWGRNLLEAGCYAKKRGKRVFLLNATWQDNPPEFIDMVSLFDGVFVREGLSAAQLAQAGVSAQVVPDLSVFAQRSASVDPKMRSEILATDGIDKDLSIKLFRASCKSSLDYVPITYPKSLSFFDRALYAVRGYKKRNTIRTPISYLKSIATSYRYSGNCLFTDQDYYATVARKSLVITARFHTLCFLVKSETPFLCLWSNSHKMQGMVADIGLDHKKYQIATENIDPVFLKNAQNDADLFGSHWTNRIRQYKTNGTHALDQMCDAIFTKN